MREVREVSRMQLTLDDCVAGSATARRAAADPLL